MKKFLIFFLVLLVIAAGGVVYAVMNAGKIVVSYKPDMERMASDALGSDVTLGDMSVSVFPSASVVIESVNVSHPDYPDDHISLEDLKLKMDLWPLLKRQVNITELSLANASITLLIKEEGIFIAGLPQAPDEEGDASDSDTASTDIPINIDLQTFTLSNASILVKDTIADVEYTLNDLDVDASMKLENNQAILSQLKGDAVAMDKIDLKFSGTDASYDLASGTLRVDTLSATSMDGTFTLAGSLNPTDPEQTLRLTSDGLKLENLGSLYDAFAPDAHDYGLAGSVNPNLTLALTPTGYTADGTVGLSGVTAGIEGLVTLSKFTGSLTVDADETLQSLAAQGMTAEINGAPLSIDLGSKLTTETGKIDPLHVKGFGGAVDLTTGLNLTEDPMPFTSGLTLEGMLLEQLVPAFAPDMPLNLTGTLKTVKGDVAGTLDENLMPSLTGTLEMAMVDGLIKDVNLGSEVLGAVNNIPFVSGALISLVPDSLRTFLEKPYTVLESVSANFAIADEQMQTENLQVVSDFFTLDAKGSIGFDTNLDLDAVIYFNETFSSGMVATTKELDVLLDDQGRMAFPVKITGVPPELSVKPDVSDILQNAVKNEATKAVTDALGVDESDSGVGGLIEGTVNKFFKKKKKK